MYTTNPKFQTTSKDVPIDVRVSDIEYPSLSEIKMKPKPTETPLNHYVPRIDRSSKPIFGPKSIDQQQPINLISVVQEREKLYDLVLQKERETLKIGEQLRNIVDAPNTQSETEQAEWFNKQTELEYKLVQTEEELNHTMTELNATATPEVEIAIQTDITKPEVKALVARIEAKKNEHLQNEQRIKQKVQEIEEKRKTVREQQKRHLQVSKIVQLTIYRKSLMKFCNTLQLKEEEEDLIRPKQPAFDRSVKPTYDNSVQRFPQIHRDFEPVYGSWAKDKGATGLKNLGNTCYMNSIIQCLLNQEMLCEYFIKDTYLKHINRYDFFSFIKHSQFHLLSYNLYKYLLRLNIFLERVKHMG